MSFNSLVFLIFLCVVLVLHYVIPHKFRWIMLLIASYIFYAYWDFNLIFLILATTVVSYLAGILIDKTEKQSVKRILLVVTLVVCLGILLFFKYFNFLSGSVTSLIRLFGGQVDDFFLNLILPVGISFYTFQTLSYVIDVYRGCIEAEKHFGYYALFVTFFPQLVAGPIERPENLIPQLKAERKLESRNLLEGFKVLVGGFVKKVVIADTLAIFVNSVYNADGFGQVTGLAVVIATLLFIMQIYCDFSGYSDIATGCAKMMGIELMVNFNRPFISQTLSEFWSRWHISLSSWFKDYIYTPLNYRAMGKKHLETRMHFNLILLFLVSGLWHGANWTFVVWGVYNGLCQVLGSLLKKAQRKIYRKFNWKEKTEHNAVLAIMRTMAILGLGLVFFRSNTLANAGVFFVKIFTDWSLSGQYFIDTFQALSMDVVGGISAVLLCILTFSIDRLVIEPRGRLDSPLDKAVSVHSSYVYLIWLIAAAWLLLIANGQSSGFIYFQF